MTPLTSSECFVGERVHVFVEVFCNERRDFLDAVVWREEGSQSHRTIEDRVLLVDVGYEASRAAPLTF